MRRQKLLGIVSILMLLALGLAACGQQAPATGGGAATAAPAGSAGGGTKDKVTLQLKWVAQAQFAGYYAAKEQGFYDAENLDVTIRPGGPDIVPEQVVASGQAQFGLNWLPSLLTNRDQGVPLVNIAQVFQYSGMREISWKDSGIVSPADLKGKKVGVWVGGNEFELLATLTKYGIDKDKDVEIVAQKFDMNAFLNRELDAASAMTYNEYYQVLAAGHKPEELNVIDFNKEGTAMLEDGIFTTEDYLKDPKNKDIAARFLRASFKGWEFCRDNPDACVKIVLQQDATGVMKEDAQKWQMDEINKLIWPLPACAADKGIGYMCPEQFKQTADIALNFKVISKPANEQAYTHEIWELATGKKAS
jgi:NitT/TauT family transport system substrate-binding protein